MNDIINQEVSIMDLNELIELKTELNAIIEVKQNENIGD